MSRRPTIGHTRRPAAAKALWWSAFVLACAANLYGVYAPSQPGPDLSFPYADKVAHVAVFAAVAWTGRTVGLRAILLAVVLILHAVTSEIVQGTVMAGRSGDPWDVVADLAGIGIGLGIWAWFGGPSAGQRSGETRPSTPDTRS